MTCEPPDLPPLDTALDALTTLGRAAPRRASPQELARGLDVLVARLTTQQQRRLRARRWSRVGLPVAACALLGLGTTWLLTGHLQASKAPALTYRIEGG